MPDPVIPVPLPDPEPDALHLHLISDATGETIHAVARACLSQFETARVREHFWNMVRNERQLAFALEEVRHKRGLVLYTLINESLRQQLEAGCREFGVPCVSILEPVMRALTHMLGDPGQAQPGRQHVLDHAYFSRIDALDFAIAHDDGQLHDQLHEADVILVGVSRSSKTPTSLYLANRGYKCANVPFVPGVALPSELFEVTRPLIVGLTKDPERLIQLRKSRVRHLQQSGPTDYIDPDKVREEVMEARRVFGRNEWPVIDVTRRAIEETAAEIITLLQRKRERMRDVAD